MHTGPINPPYFRFQIPPLIESLGTIVGSGNPGTPFWDSIMIPFLEPLWTIVGFYWSACGGTQFLAIPVLASLVPGDPIAVRGKIIEHRRKLHSLLFCLPHGPEGKVLQFPI